MSAAPANTPTPRGGSFQLKPRERRLVFISLVLISCWLLVSWLVQPLWDRNAALRLQVATHTEKLDKIKRLVTQMPTIHEDYQRIAGYLTQADNEGVQRALLSDLEALSRSSGVQLNLKPRLTRREGELTRYEVEVDVEGDQAKLLHFLDGLMGMPKLIAIDRLRISTVPAKPDLLRANVMVQHFTNSS